MKKLCAYTSSYVSKMKATLLILAIGFATVLSVSVEEQWEFIPDVEGRFHLVHIDDIKLQAKLSHRNDFAVRFLLFTKSNPTSPQEIITGDTASITNSYFSAGRPTRVLIHGWTGDENDGPGTTIRQAYLNRGDYNVIVVDWSAGAKDPNYIAARYNVETAGRKTAELLNFLSTLGLSFNDVYLAGHSLGAHVAGYAGKFSNSKPNTIFGLDSALPLFYLDTPSTRLAVGDAMHVQSIHTDGGRKGFFQPIGDSAFYPEWSNVQPGCGWDLLGSCSHGRVVDYFAESLQADNQFLGKDCGSIENIEKKTCNGSAIAKMGGDPAITSARGVYYVPINSNSPFATGRV